MRKRFLAAGTALALAAGGTSNAAEPGTIEGTILDTTCFGPCVDGMEPVPYTGQARVVITRRPGGRRIDALAPEPDGSFEVRLSPGRYMVEVRIEDPCFEEDGRVLRVSRGGDIDRPELFVYNTCIK